MQRTHNALPDHKAHHRYATYIVCAVSATALRMAGLGARVRSLAAGADLVGLREAECAGPDREQALLGRCEFASGFRTWDLMAEHPLVHEGEHLDEASCSGGTLALGDGTVGEEDLGASAIDVSHGLAHALAELGDALGELHGGGHGRAMLPPGVSAGVDRAGDLLGRLSGLVQGGEQTSGDVVVDGLDHACQEGVFGGEVEIEGGARDAGGGRDIGDGGIVKGAFLE
jgi:hypothetical protein